MGVLPDLSVFIYVYHPTTAGLQASYFGIILAEEFLVIGCEEVTIKLETVAE